MIDQTSENMARCLENNRSYRVLRKFEPLGSYNKNDNGDEVLIGVFLDTETTGLHSTTDKIIELGIVQFEFVPDGRIFRILKTYNGFEDPGQPISEEISRLTGITDEMVSGQKIDLKTVLEIIEPAAVVIAHNANFDRKFIEPLESAFEKKAWACSMSDIDWNREGIEGVKLEYIAYRFGFFYDGHRASSDCLAGIHILSHELPVSKKLALKAMLDRAREKDYRIWAMGSPFESKDILKARGYRWNSGENGQPKSWYIDLSGEKRTSETKFLYNEIYGREVELRMDVINAYNRYSNRI
ncbi:MAG: 3'-5' exonuclease [Desulfocapsaceae bacterium]|nr:3'-5' exonuclease [Desulfocapsaceae bacterium]